MVHATDRGGSPPLPFLDRLSVLDDAEESKGRGARVKVP